MPVTSDSLTSKPWKDVTIIDGNINPFQPDDMHQFRFRVHSEVIPSSEEDQDDDAKPMVQPVLINNQGRGVIYEKGLLDSLYNQKRYRQYVLQNDHTHHIFDSPSHAIYYNAQENCWQCCVFHDANTKQLITLPNFLIAESQVSNFLLSQTQVFLNHNQATVYATTFPTSINEFLIRKTHYITEPNNTTAEQLRGPYFLPHDQQFVCFACTGSIHSKMDHKQTIETDHPLVGIFRCENRESTTFLMLEEKDENLCGRITVYQLLHQPKTPQKTESLAIKKNPICHEDYAQITQKELLKQYNLSEKQVRARTFKITAEKAKELKKLIKADQEKAKTKHLQYSKYAGKIMIEIYASLQGLFSGGFEYQNEASWCIGILIKAEILNSRPEFHYDKQYEIPKSIPWSTIFLGQTPDRMLPLPEKQNAPAPSGSGV